MLSRAHASTPTLDSQVRSVLTLCDITYSRLTSSASSQLFDRRMLSLSFRLPRSEASVVHPFRPSFHVPSSPSIQRTDARARGSLLVIAISGSMRLHSLVTAITGSVRPSHVGGTARHRHLRVGAASLARHCHHRVSAAFTHWWHCSSPLSPGRCGLSCSSLPSPGQYGLHALVALLVTAISGSVRPLLLLLLVAASR